MSTIDRRLDQRIPIDHAGGVSFGEIQRGHAIPGTISGLLALLPPDRLSGTGSFGEIEPRDSGPVLVDHACDRTSIALE
ncbi:hypothetical protein [Corynebacterium sp. CNJ-954]|uniref:hypothetical protein n=1 Tax=Corynebacterium sp. CNJ-954 TaxID=1904962 RepID=UPI0011152E0E|nr:hypothetical protein [Corynebacterium sp. CNJ-954]